MRKGLECNRIFFANVGKSSREPLRTIEEMAEEFNVTYAQLRALMKEDGAPSPQLKLNNKRTQKRSWYKPSEMRKWWKARQEA